MKLWAAREASGKTQAQVADAANIAVRAYQNYEYGKRNPSVRTAIRIASALGSTVETLFSSDNTLDDIIPSKAHAVKCRLEAVASRED